MNWELLDAQVAEGLAARSVVALSPGVFVVSLVRDVNERLESSLVLLDTSGAKSHFRDVIVPTLDAQSPGRLDVVLDHGTSESGFIVYQHSGGKLRRSSRLVRLDAGGRPAVVARWPERFLGVDIEPAGVFWTAGWNRAYDAVEVRRWTPEDGRLSEAAELAREVDIAQSGARAEGVGRTGIGITALKIVRRGAWLGTYTHGVAWVRLSVASGPPEEWLGVGRPDRDNVGRRELSHLGDANALCLHDGR